jgi:hypothetical protein
MDKASEFQPRTTVARMGHSLVEDRPEKSTVSRTVLP